MGEQGTCPPSLITVQWAGLGHLLVKDLYDTQQPIATSWHVPHFLKVPINSGRFTPPILPPSTMTKSSSVRTLALGLQCSQG